MSATIIIQDRGDVFKSGIMNNNIAFTTGDKEKANH